MLKTISIRFLRLARDTRGNVAVMFGLMLIPLAVAVGAGVDYGHAVEIRSTLQSAVDAAALSGASAYTAPSAKNTAKDLAQSYVTKGTATLPSNVTVKSTTVTPGTTGSGNGDKPSCQRDVRYGLVRELRLRYEPNLLVR